MRFLFTDKHGVDHKNIGINTVIVLLGLWTQGQLELTWDEWEQLTGFLHCFLDNVYDNKYRITRLPRNMRE